MIETCVVCGAASLDVVPAFHLLRRVTSDCRPFAAGGALRQCTRCGAVQKPDTPQWRADCAAIYSAYDSYGLSEGAEQAVRSGDGKEFAPRSEIVLRRYQAATGAQSRGRLLDFGCGKGPTSRAASRVLPGWTIEGYDLDDRALPTLTKIPGFARLHTGEPGSLPGGYDLIVLMHALEHLPSPIDTLRLLAGKLAPGGHILVEVPDREANPYDLLVADHLIHFDLASLGAIGRRAGLAPTLLTRDWVAKELSLLLSPVAAPDAAVDAGKDAITAHRQTAWLLAVADLSRHAASQRPLCIFGTSIVGTWLASELPAPPDLYLDEDPGKIGRGLDGVPIIAPTDAPRGSTVILALAPAVAAAVAARLAPLGLNFVTAPEYPPS